MEQLVIYYPMQIVFKTLVKIQKDGEMDILILYMVMVLTYRIYLQVLLLVVHQRTQYFLRMIN